MLRSRLLFDGDMLRITDVDCSFGRGGCGEVEREDVPRVVFPRSGAFAYHFSLTGETVVDANTAVVLRPDMQFRVSHPIDGGDRCTVVELRDEMFHRRHSAIVPLSTTGAYAIHLARRVAIQGGDPLHIEEHALAAIDALGGTKMRDRRGSELVERAKAVIAQNPYDARSLRDIACAVGASPFHLTRTFTKVTGASLHAYRMQLRLRHAMERAIDGEPLARIAADCGFSNHSQFSAAFRRSFGTVPSQLRKILIAR